MIQDYRITVTVKNNYMLSAMLEAGMETAAELAKASGVANTEVGLYLNLKKAPYSKNGLRNSIVKIAKCLKRLPEDLFPPQHLTDILENNKASFDVSLDQVGHLVGYSETPQLLLEHAEGVEAIKAAMSTLSHREQDVLRKRFGFGCDQHTLDDVASIYNISRERTRQIEKKALARLKKFNEEKLQFARESIIQH